MKQEFFVEKGELILEKDWIKHINSFKPDSELEYPEKIIVTKLRAMVDEAIKERIEGLDDFGICFSGGLDSSYIAAIAKKSKSNFTCYTVGFQDGQFKNPEDIMHAKEVAKHLRLTEDEFQSKVFNLKEMDSIITKTTKILKDASQFYGIKVNNVVTVGVGSVEVAAHSLSQENKSHKQKIFFSGLGSEEIYAGYDRHKQNPTNGECYDGLLKMYQRDLLRDTAIPKALKFGFTTPFLDEELIKYSLQIPVQFKINNTNTKLILRKAAEPYLGKYSERPKRAAQYGSSFDKAIEKLAGMKGFKSKYEYLESL